MPGGTAQRGRPPRRQPCRPDQLLHPLLHRAALSQDPPQTPLNSETLAVGSCIDAWAWSRRRTPPPAAAGPPEWPGSPRSRGRCATCRHELRVRVDLEVQAVITRSGAVRRQQLPPARPEQITHRYLHAGAGKHGVDLVLQTATQPDQLGPMPHPAAHLPGRGRGDPGLGQSTHAQTDLPGPRRRVDRSSLAGGRTSSPPTGAPDTPACPARPGCPQPSTRSQPPPASKNRRRDASISASAAFLPTQPPPSTRLPGSTCL